MGKWYYSHKLDTTALRETSKKLQSKFNSLSTKLEEPYMTCHQAGICQADGADFVFSDQIKLTWNRIEWNWKSTESSNEVSQ